MSINRIKGLYILISNITYSASSQQYLEEQFQKYSNIVMYTYCPASRKCLAELCSNAQCQEIIKRINNKKIGITKISVKVIKDDVCEMCNEPAVYQFTCNLCLESFYCSKDCIRKNRSKHLYSCRGMVAYYHKLISNHTSPKIYKTQTKEFQKECKKYETQENLEKYIKENRNEINEFITSLHDMDVSVISSRFLSHFQSEIKTLKKEHLNFHYIKDNNLVKIIGLDRKAMDTNDSGIDLYICDKYNLFSMENLQEKIQHTEISCTNFDYSRIERNDLVLVFHARLWNRAFLISEPDRKANKYYLYLLDVGEIITTELRNIAYMPPSLVKLPVYLFRVSLFSIGKISTNKKIEFLDLLFDEYFTLLWVEDGVVMLYDLQSSECVSVNEILLQNSICERET